MAPKNKKIIQKFLQNNRLTIKGDTVYYSRDTKKYYIVYYSNSFSRFTIKDFNDFHHCYNYVLSNYKEADIMHVINVHRFKQDLEEIIKF